MCVCVCTVQAPSKADVVKICRDVFKAINRSSTQLPDALITECQTKLHTSPSETHNVSFTFILPGPLWIHIPLWVHCGLRDFGESLSCINGVKIQRTVALNIQFFDWCDWERDRERVRERKKECERERKRLRLIEMTQWLKYIHTSHEVFQSKRYEMGAHECMFDFGQVAST